MMICNKCGGERVLLRSWATMEGDGDDWYCCDCEQFVGVEFKPEPPPMPNED